MKIGNKIIYPALVISSLVVGATIDNKVSKPAHIEEGKKIALDSIKKVDQFHSASMSGSYAFKEIIDRSKIENRVKEAYLKGLFESNRISVIDSIKKAGTTAKTMIKK